MAEHVDSSYLVLERNNSSLRLIDNNLKVSTLIGRQGAGFQDGPVRNARLQRPRGMLVCKDQSVLIADAGNHCIRRIDKALTTVTTVAGTPGTPGFADGTSVQGGLRFPASLLELPGGAILIADQYNHALRLLKDDKLTRIAGTGEQGCVDGPAHKARLNMPSGMCLMSSTRVAFVDSGSHAIRCLDLDTMTVSTVAGVPNQIGYVNGHVQSALFSTPTGICMGLQNTLIVTDTGNHCIRAILPSGQVVTAAGRKEPGHADGLEAAALFSQPVGVSFCADSSLLVVDSSTHVRIGYVSYPVCLIVTDHS